MDRKDGSIVSAENRGGAARRCKLLEIGVEVTLAPQPSVASTVVVVERWAGVRGREIEDDESLTGLPIRLRGRSDGFGSRRKGSEVG